MLARKRTGAPNAAGSEFFQGSVPPFRLKPAYRLGLLLVAFATVLLPILYVALVVLVGLGVHWYAVHATTVLEGGSIFYRLLLYVGPLIAGAVLILFMLKPLLARPGRGPAPLELRPEDHPRLFALLEQVRRAVRAPAPRAVGVDCSVNASASFRRGRASLFGTDLKLTIGLPLLRGLTMRQLVGVLAHEFGHFSQGSGMRLTYLVRSVNGWFARVVYERDAWDDALRRSGEDTDFRIAIVIHLSRFMIWITRRILWALMMLGHGISTFMLRQMEFDADRYEAHVAGSDCFESTALRLRVLALCSQHAIALLADSYAERRLCDDFPALVVGLAETMPPEVRAGVEGAAQKRSLFDTHPPDAARIERARREAAPGLCRLEEAASTLVEDFPAVSRAGTIAFYRDVHGIDAKPENFVGVAEFFERAHVVTNERQSFARYFRGVFGIDRPLELPQELPDPVVSPDRGLERLQEKRAEVERCLATARARRGPEDTTPPLNFYLEAIVPLRDAIRDRFLAALALLGTPEVRARLPEPEALSQELQRYYSMARTLAQLEGHVTGILAARGVAMGNLQRLQNARHDESLARQAVDALGRLQGDMLQLVRRLRELAYPFEHAAGQLSIAEYAGADPLPPVLDWSALPHTDHVLERLNGLYDRCLGHLAEVAERIETGLGLIPVSGDASPEVAG